MFNFQLFLCTASVYYGVHIGHLHVVFAFEVDRLTTSEFGGNIVVVV